MLLDVQVTPGAFLSIVIIIIYIYHALINALSGHMIHINLNMIFYTHVEHSHVYAGLYPERDHFSFSSSFKFQLRLTPDGFAETWRSESGLDTMLLSRSGVLWRLYYVYIVYT